MNSILNLGRGCLAVLIVMLLATGAQAEFEKNWYIGVAGTMADLDVEDFDEANAGEFVLGRRIDDDGNIAVELGYLAEMEFENDTTSATIETVVYKLGLAFEGRFTRTLVGTAGIGAYKASSDFLIADTVVADDSTNGGYANFGIGMRMGGIGFDLEVDYLPDVADERLIVSKLGFNVQF